MIALNEFIPKTMESEKENRRYKLHFTVDEIPEYNKKIEKEEIGIWYETRTPTNGRNIHYSILPRFINADKELYESIGLYLAEGALDGYHLNLGNDEPEVINTFIRAFKRNFKVPFANWSWSIGFNNKLKKNENEEITERRERTSINFWLKKTEISPDSSLKTPCRYSNRNSSGELRTRKRWGSLTIVYGNRILKNLWMEIMDSLVKKTLQERDRNNAASILRGWIAGDGYCRYKVYEKAQRELGVGCTDKKRLQILYKLFNILGIKPHKEKNGLRFTKAEYLVKAYNYKLTSLHLPKHLNLLKCLLSYERIPESIEKLDLRRAWEELNDMERRIKEREELFEKFKNKGLPKLREGINWQLLMNGLLLKEEGNYEKLMKEIGCPKTVLINWVKKGIKPSRKYRIKILEKIKGNEEGLINFGEFFLKGNWMFLFEGLQVFLKASRKEIAKKLRIHVNTIESIINQRSRMGKNVASKALNLIEKYGKTPKNILQIYKESRNINWTTKIKKILIDNKWSQRELAEKLGCSRSLAREWVGGLEPTNKYKGKLLEIPSPFNSANIGVS